MKKNLEWGVFPLDAQKHQRYISPIFRRSSAVEQLTVNQLVVGSIPTAGANTTCKVLKVNDKAFHLGALLSFCSHSLTHPMTQTAFGGRSIEKNKHMPAFGAPNFVILLAASASRFFSKNHSNPFFVFSLRTHVVREAGVLARRLTWLSLLAFDYAKGAAKMETGTMERVLSELM